jgi:hypothetical protein
MDSVGGRAGSTRFAQLTFLIAGAAFGALLFAAVGGITHLAVAGAFAGTAVGSVVGAAVGLGLWSRRVSVLTVGGIVGAAFFSVTACTPSGIFAPFGFVVGWPDPFFAESGANAQRAVTERAGSEASRSSSASMLAGFTR